MDKPKRNKFLIEKLTVNIFAVFSDKKRIPKYSSPYLTVRQGPAAALASGETFSKIFFKG